jgi:Icc-related predicted phosphoesterase
MNLLVIADDESLLHTLPDVRADLLVSCGDLPEELILRVAARVHCSRILAVKGNHDSGAPFPPSITNLHLQTIEAFGLTFGGFAGSWRYKHAGNHLYEQNEVEAALSDFPRVDIFVAHNSPRLIHDRDDDIHLGFGAFVTYIDRARPRLFLHGHQHIQQESTVGFTRVIGTYGHRLLQIATRG